MVLVGGSDGLDLQSYAENGNLSALTNTFML